MERKASDIPKKVVNTEAYMHVIREIISEGHEVSLLITGNSMNPFLADGRDTILIRKPERLLKKGDMVFYRRKNGQYVMHRICRVQEDESGRRDYYMIGDAQQEREGPIGEHMIFGLISMVRRKGKWIGKGNFWWEFFEHIWLYMIPLRGWIMGIYRWFTGRKE